MSPTWQQSTLQAYIDGQVEESLQLEYKAAEALGRQNNKTTEITKDVSAMANSAGGTVVYGIKEFDLHEKRHLPETLDPINRNDFSREWLEQIIQNIHPRVDGVTIHSVQLDSSFDHLAYVVEIPQSTTAHQAMDKRYYKRYNFAALAMEDYEVRDTMARQQHPRIELSFRVEITTDTSVNFVSRETLYERTTKSEHTLLVTARNIGRVYAQFVNSAILIPAQLLNVVVRTHIQAGDEVTYDVEGAAYYEYHKENTIRDVVDTKSTYGSFPVNIYGPTRFVPILPGLTWAWRIKLFEDFEDVDRRSLAIRWQVYADNAPPVSGVVGFSDIAIADRRVAKPTT
jgi:Putative DNA-binding domain